MRFIEASKEGPLHVEGKTQIPPRKEDGQEKLSADDFKIIEEKDDLGKAFYLKNKFIEISRRIL